MENRNPIDYRILEINSRLATDLINGLLKNQRSAIASSNGVVIESIKSTPEEMKQIIKLAKDLNLIISLPTNCKGNNINVLSDTDDDDDDDDNNRMNMNNGQNNQPIIT